jgi:CysZ protein
MDNLNNHIFALKFTFQKLFLGKFWVYLIPSLLFSLLFLSISPAIFNYQSLEVTDVLDNKGFFQKVYQSFDRMFVFVLKESYKFVILTFLSPVYCLLSEKVDEVLTGTKFPFNFYHFIKDVLRAIFNILVALMLNLFYVGLWFFISFLFGLEKIDFIVYFLISSYFVGFAFYDYSLERYHVNLFASWSFLKTNRINTMMTGALFYLIFYIPSIGIFFAPFITSIVSTVVFLIKTNRYKVTN